MHYYSSTCTPTIKQKINTVYIILLDYSAIYMKRNIETKQQTQSHRTQLV